MTDKRPRKAIEPSLKLDMDFNEALQRLVQTDPREIADALERNRHEVEAIGERVAERRTKLRAALSGPKKKFRI